MLWLIFPFTPAPNRSGATDSFTLSKNGRTSICNPAPMIFSVANATISGGTLSPMI
jgi:hypothetical protein